MTCTDGTHLGLQIPNFTWPAVAAGELFERVAAVTVTAEQSGFDTVFVMDHFFQLPLIGPPEVEMFEVYTLLGALAARTTTARLGTLVTGVTYRNPALLAKAVTALDVVSGGRALLGIGAARYDTEHAALDVRFPPMSERYERLEDALRICRAMFTERQSTVAGRHHSVTDAWNSPAPITPGAAPILVGGSGERKTFGLAAKYADELNVNASFVAQGRGARGSPRRARPRPLGDHGDLPGHDRHRADPRSRGRAKGRGPASQPRARRSRRVARRPRAHRGPVARFLWGDADDVAAQVARLRAAGVDGVVVNMILDGHDVDSVAFAGETLTKALA
jgi:F420-dependent oxidoreductase-like protein